MSDARLAQVLSERYGDPSAAAAEQTAPPPPPAPKPQPSNDVREHRRVLLEALPRKAAAA
ncbi:hypothetical protein GCM10029963_53450 [Micromonospora andamanensis]|uniref:hypothetical protein n=1 Tax=Micromonospora andamanensis TaxID=1287068 RepID=UPI00194E54F4|nr:hypothetical protein [Micromonospora andamanensis]GIJ36707.1 hypothetical protein Vwe01_00320 [Micromonospora andamanensis]